MDVARKLIELLSARERLLLVILFAALLMVACLEMVSVASVLPFLSVAADPTLIQSNAWLAWAYDLLGFTSTNSFLLALAGASLFALVVTNASMAAAQWGQIRFAMARNHQLSCRLLEHYLAQPYVFFLRRNSMDLGKNILGETDQVTLVLIAALRLAAKALVVVAIVVTLIVFDPLLALVMTAVLGGAYGLIYVVSRQRLSHLGKQRVDANRTRYQLAAEAFGAIKDVKLLGREKAFYSRFISPSRRFNRSQASSLIISDLPRYALEALAFGGVLVIAIYLLMSGQGLQQTIPVLGFYAFAGYRLMPSLQRVFSSYTKLRYGGPAVDNLHCELGRNLAPPALQPPDVSRLTEILPLAEQFELDGVTLAYQGTEEPVLRDVSLSIEANSTVGIVGPTGAGKTTLVDVILGLLRPQSGEICVDGVPLTDANLRAWQNGLGYVPQHIYLTDDSIANNIAFGVPNADINREAIERAARIAKIHEFITTKLPDGYDSSVGERGIRLSGGQRQRIGIARALYQDPAVIVFDEATNALDGETEEAVMEAINELAGSRTILMIAHRLSTLNSCHMLLRVKDGQVLTESRSDRPNETV